MTETTKYSDEIPGEHSNYGWGVKLDKSTQGFVGISQSTDGGVIERVLLSPRQYREFVAFAGKPRTRPSRPPRKRR